MACDWGVSGSTIPLVSLQGHFFSLFEAALGYGVSLLLVLLVPRLATGPPPDAADR